MEKMIKDIYSERFGGDALIVRSPGRINIIGEHTDYNQGFVLPAAIDKFIYVGIGKRSDNSICLFTNTLKQSHESRLNSVCRTEKRWPNYVLGVVDQLQKNGYDIGGFNLVIDGDIPDGAGLSSSAALECSTIFALNELFELGLTRINMAKMAQLAEHEFAGVKCGIMDQFASMFGRKDQLIKLDCRTLEFAYVPLNLMGYRIVLFNSNVKHSLVSSEYNIRRAQCERGIELVKEHLPIVNSLRDIPFKIAPRIVLSRDINIEMLDKYVLNKSPLIYKRCKYVIEENQRLQQCCADLKSGNIENVGAGMFRTHQGLAEEYEVSCKEIDWLVDQVKNRTDVLGSRIVGGGFGGCTINIVKEGSIESLSAELSKKYNQFTGLDLSTYTVGIGQGTEVFRKEKVGVEST